MKTLWDPGSTISLITFQMAQQLELKAQARVRLDLVVVGAEKEIITSYKYKVMLHDAKHRTVSIDVYGIDKISSEIASIEIKSVQALFPNVLLDNLKRPSSGHKDCLIGYN